MMHPDLTITDYALRQRVLGRRADTRLAEAMRRPTSLPAKLRLKMLQGGKARRQHIRHWQDGCFVDQPLSLPRAA